MKKRWLEIRLISKTFILALILLSTASACATISSLTRQGGMLLNVELKTDEPNLEAITDRAVTVMQNRLDAIGADGEVRKTSPNRIEIKLYGSADVERLKKFLLTESRFELRKIIGPPSPAPLRTFPSKEAAIKDLGGTVPQNRKILPYMERDPDISPGEWIVVENPSVIDGSQLRDASAYESFDESGNYQINFTLTPAGAEKFGDWTGKNIGNYLGIVLNDEVKSAVFIKSQIFDQGQIDGRFTKQSAEDLALILKSGYLPASFRLIDEKKFE